MNERSHTGTSECQHCGSVNPWRSDFKYSVGEGIRPGFLGECRTCHKRDPQTVTQLTPDLQSANAISTPEEENQ